MVSFVWTQRVRTRLFAAGLCLFAAACSTPPDRLAADSGPADPGARGSATSYRSVLGGYVSQRPVEPAPWREQNDRVAPRKR
jgi:hypothetical protein